MDTAGPRANEVRATKAIARVTETEAVEPKTANGRDGAGAAVVRADASGQIDLVERVSE